jgi:hypothetical protein
MSIETTLAERGARYGSFEEHATIAQAIQDAFRIYPEKWEKLPPVIKQGFTTLADKIARTLNGDEYYDDNYHDIGGYAKLMEDWVRKHNQLLELVREVVPVELATEYAPGTITAASITTG